MTQAPLLLHGDCFDVLKTLPDASIDAIVTDPPYGLGTPPPILDVLRAWVAGEPYRPTRKGGGFMGAEWDAFVPGPEVWRECLRVLKPGGHLLAFFGTRTLDVGGLAIRLAGFEPRDLIAWLYGTGFPKSLDVSKAIDRAAGAEREVLSERPASYPGNMTREYQAGLGKRPQGEGWGSEGKPIQVTAPATPEAQAWEGWGTALKPALEPVMLARKPLGASTIAANVLTYGTGAIHVDACRIPTTDDLNGGAYSGGTPKTMFEGSGRLEADAHVPPSGRWPANVVLDEEAAEALDAQAGERKSGSRAPGVRKGLGYHGAQGDGGPAIKGSEGGAIRFFYCAKASKVERARSEDGKGHPTVKPQALMRWLVRLITPPGGTVLDPFAGSGSTLIAASAEGFHSIGIEREAAYVEIARKRLGLDAPSEP